MLEYLLLRPADIDLFEGEHGGHWRFIVARRGARLRRGQGRGARRCCCAGCATGSRPAGRLQCIATSATVGDDRAGGDRLRAPAVRRARSSGYTATRPAGPRAAPAASTPRPAAGGRSAPPTTRRSRRAADPGADAASPPPGGTASPTATPTRLLAAEQRMRKLRALLADGGPQPLEDLAVRVFAGEHDGTVRPAAALAALVAAGQPGPRPRRHPAALRALPPVHPRHRGRVHLPVRARAARVAVPPRALPRLPRARVRVRPPANAAATSTWPGTAAARTRRSASVPQRRPQDRTCGCSWATPRSPSTTMTTTLEEAAARTTPPRTHAVRSAAGALGTAAARLRAPAAAGRAVRAVRKLRSRNASPQRLPGLRGARRRHGAPLGERQRGRRRRAGHRALPGAARGRRRRNAPTGPAAAASCSRSATAARPPRSSRPTWSTATRCCSSGGSSLEGLERGFDAADDVPGGRPDRPHRAAGRARRESSSGACPGRRRERAAGLWVMRELVATDDRQSLEGRGLLRVRWTAPRACGCPGR